MISSDLELRQRVDAELRTFLDEAVARMQAAAADLQPFAAALRSFVVDGGNRLRPAFCYWTYAGLAGNGESSDESAAVRGAASLELLQAAALIHDDVIDNSSTRRGKPSLHEHFAELHGTQQWLPRARVGRCNAREQRTWCDAGGRRATGLGGDAQ